MPRSPPSTSRNSTNSRLDPFPTHRLLEPYRGNWNSVARSDDNVSQHEMPSSVPPNFPVIQASSVSDEPNDTVESKTNTKITKRYRVRRRKMDEGNMYAPTDSLAQRLVNDCGPGQLPGDREELLWWHFPNVFDKNNNQSVWSKLGIEPKGSRWEYGKPSEYLKALDSSRAIFNLWYDKQPFKIQHEKSSRDDFDERIAEHAKLASDHLISEILSETHWTPEERVIHRDEIDRVTEYCSSLLIPDLMDINGEMTRNAPAGNQSLIADDGISYITPDMLKYKRDYRTDHRRSYKRRNYSPIEELCFLSIHAQGVIPKDKGDNYAWTYIKDILTAGTHNSLWSTLNINPQCSRWGQGPVDNYMRAISTARNTYEGWYHGREYRFDRTKTIDENLQAMATEEAVKASEHLMEQILFAERWEGREKTKYRPEITQITDYLSTLLTPILIGVNRQVFLQLAKGLTSQEAIFASEPIGERLMGIINKMPYDLSDAYRH